MANHRNSPSAASIRDLEQELAAVKRSLQALSTEPAPDEQEPPPAKAGKRKKGPAPRKADAADHGAFIRQFREQYYDRRDHELERRATSVAGLRAASERERLKTWAALWERLQRDKHARREAVLHLKEQALRDRAERLEWIKRNQEDTRRQLADFVRQLAEQQARDRQARQQALQALRKARLDSLK